MHALEDTARLYDLLREAGDEPVTLDELAVAGVADPAGALLDLELAGHAVHRVLDNRAECVRLAPFDGVHLLAEPQRPGSPPAEERVHAVPGPPPAAQHGSPRSLVVAAALLLLALLFAARR